MSCDGCRRAAEMPEYTSHVKEHARVEVEKYIVGQVIPAMTTPCFHFRLGEREPDQERMIPGWKPGPGTKPADYIVTINYNLELYDDWIKPDGQSVVHG
jgi:hypothetical protein